MKLVILAVAWFLATPLPLPLPGGPTPTTSAIPTPAPTATPAPAPAQPVDNASHLYTVDGYGGLHAAGQSAPLRSTHYFGWDIARGLAITADARGGYILDGYGGIAPIGDTPEPGASYIQVYFGWDIARAIALTPWSTPGHPSGYILDGWGGVHPFGGAPEFPTPGYWAGWDIARALVISADSTPTDIEGWMLDGFGGLHSFGSGAHRFQKDVDMTWFGFDVARGLVAEPGSTTGRPALYVLDAFGGINALGAAPKVDTPAYCPGCEFAHSIAAWTRPGGGGGWVQDGYGTLYPFGGAPSLDSNAHYGFDIARGVTGSGGGSGTLPGNFGRARPAANPPTRVRIPEIGVDAPVENIRLDDQGNLQVPSQPYDTGWWQDGPWPGRPGHTIIDGHKDSWSTGPAVFYNLDAVRPGYTRISITQADGSVSEWVASSKNQYRADEVPPGFFTGDGPSRIELITCGGDFNGQRYSGRLVVEAVPA